MNGKTAFEKIIDSHLLRTLPDGSMILKLDRVWGHEITPPNGIQDAEDRGCDVVFNPNKVKMMIDHVSPAKDTDSARQGQIIRDWSSKHGIEFLDVGHNGICHRVIPESGWILPGQIGIMPDSHTCTHGAMCAFTAGVGTTEWEVGVMTGLWVCPPQKVIKVDFVGELPANVFSKDLILALIGHIGVKGAVNAVVEIGGPVIEKLSMGARMTMTNMIIEAGGTCGMIMVDGKMIDYLWHVISDNFPDKDKAFMAMSLINSDADAAYDRVIEIDVSKMAPVAAVDYSPGNVVSIAAIAGKKVQQVFIGSCTNGGIEDLRIAAYLIEKFGGKIASGLRCVIVPATQTIYIQALREGLLEIFAKAGCFVSGPSCAACLGMSCGVIAPGEVCVSTSNRNFPGRMGEGGEVILVSPATAAMTAVYGCIKEPKVAQCEPMFDSNMNIFQGDFAWPTDWKTQPFKLPDYTELLVKIGGLKPKQFGGKIFYLPNADVDTDQIIPASCLNKIGKAKLGKFCFTGLKTPLAPEQRDKLFRSKVLVAGSNFGCGSSREHAPWALEGAGITCVIAESFARIFYNNMFANGLICIQLSKYSVEALLKSGDENVVIDWEIGVIRTSGSRHFHFNLTDHERNLVRSGGLVPVMLKMTAELQQQGKLS